MSVSKFEATSLRRLLSEARRTIYGVLVFSCGVNILMLTAPLFMLQVYDRVLGSGSPETLLFLAIIALFALMAMGGLDATRRIALARIGDWVDQTISGGVLSHTLQKLTVRQSTPSSRSLRDVSLVRGYMASEAPFAILDMPWVFVFVTVVFMLHPILGLVALAGAVLLLTLVIANQVVTRKLAAGANEAAVLEYNQAESVVRNADAIEAMGIKVGLSKLFDHNKQSSLRVNRQFTQANTLFSVTTKFLRMALQVAILGFGALLAIKGEITPGAMIAGSILMGRALAPIEMAVGSWRQTLNVVGATGRIRSELEEIDRIQPRTPLPSPTGVLTVEAVSYFHQGQSEPTIADLNFQLRPGEMLGIIGPMGTGKTTLARLLMGLASPTRGSVRLDGADLTEWDRDEVGPYIGYLPQNVDLIAGTVAENISRFKLGAEQAMYAAAHSVGVHDIVLKLKGGYDAFIGEGGQFLSGGQRQRVGLARALFGDPKLIILDEPNSNLDRLGENALIYALGRLKADERTLVVISHRPRILEQADKILVLIPGGQHRIGPRDAILNSMGSGQPILPVIQDDGGSE